MKFFIFTLSFVFISFNAFCGWVNINSGINDDLTSISFLGTTGLITGKKGVYISSNGGTTSGSWIRAQNYFASADSITYNHSQFHGSIRCYAAINKFFFCGEDTVTHNGVIFEYSITNGTISLLYTGPIHSRFNALSQNANIIYVVGNNGLIVSFNQVSPTYNIVSTNFNLDLNSISIANNYVVIGSEDYVIRGLINTSFPDLISFSQDNYPNRKIKDVLYITSVNNMYAVGKNILHRIANTVTEPHQYYSDSLDANTIINYSNKIFIGTSSGIYRSHNSTDILEFQPTTSIYHILGIQVSGTTLFACGKNGVILYTTDQGGNPEPYAKIDYNGGCLNTQSSIGSTKGTVTNCTNYVDNTIVNSSCTSYGYTFSTLGTHEIKLTVSNASYSKTITKTITIVPTPQINLLTEGIDSILCKQEVLDFTIFNAENNVFYSLYKSGSNAYFGSSPIANGNDLNFQTNVLSQAGNYYIRATNSLANCYVNFTNVISIAVEKPVSRIYYDIINAEVNEDIRFYQKSFAATSFEWHFTNSPTIPVSNLADPINSFSGIGSSQVTLISGTENNCFDSITIRGPFVYQPYTIDTSWLLLNSRTAPLTNNVTIGEDIIKTIKSRSGGYVVIGNYLHRQVNSRVGDSVNLPGFGQYVAKYNDYGILKWCFKSISVNTSAFDYHIITDVTEDSQGNLFFTGNTNSVGIIDNKGDTLLANKSFLLKTDSLGKTIWSRSSNVYQNYYYSVNHDYDDYIYLTMGVGSITPFLFNEIPSDTLSSNEAVCPSCNGKYKVVKLDNNGVKLSDFMIEISSANSYETPQVVFDTLNNMYLWGSKEINGVIHEPVTGDTIQLYNTPGNYSGKMYICKFDVNGNYQWKMQGYTVDALNDRTEILELIADESGNLYATGQNDFSSDALQSPHIIVNSDNSQTAFFGGKYFITKISPDGITQWIKGNYISYYGMGLDILLDGDTIYTVVMARTINYTPLQHEFLGENNLSVSVNSSPYNYFIAKYTTNGEIQTVYLNGPSNTLTGQLLDINSYPDLIKLDDGYFLLNKSVSIHNAPDPATDFGFTLPYTGFPQDGTQLKIKLSQGVEFLPHYLASVYDTVCYGTSYILPNGTELEDLTSATIYEDSLIGSNGNDSITKYYISVNPKAIQYQTVEVCFGDDYEIANDTTFTNIGLGFVYDQLITSSTSCDSIIRYQFVVNPVSTTSAAATVCQGNDLVLSNGVIAATNMQHDSIVEITLQSISGCDSTVNIAVQVVEVNELVTQNGYQLESQDPGALHQWVNCNNNFSAIPGQTNYSFTPVLNGNYAVIVNRNGCIDTSICYSITDLSINELGYEITIYPNPTSNKSIIDFGQKIGSTGIAVYSNDGRKILEALIQGVESYELDLSTFVKGTYFVRITSDEHTSSEFVLVKN